MIADTAVVHRQTAVQDEAADIAENGGRDVQAAKREVLEAITAAENDGFSVGEDLTVTDTRKYDISTIAERNKAAAEHAEDIRWFAERLVQTDTFTGQRLQEKAAELQGIRFDGEDEGSDGEGTVRLVDHETHVKPDEERKDERGDKPAEQAAGQIGPFAVPKSVEDVAKKPDDKPSSVTSDVGGDLGDLLGADDTPDGKPEDGQPAKPGADDKPAGLPPVLSQVRQPPDKATIDRQAAKVETARQNLDAAQAKLDDAAGQDYTQGAGAGPGRDTSGPLAQAVFDARAELTEQRRILNELNYAAAAAGSPTAPVAPLPENADVQAYPPEPSAFAEGSRALSEGSLGLIPDVAKDIDTFNNWDQASGADRLQASLDAAGMLPLPGAKPLAEGIEHGLDALGGAARHFDDAPGIPNEVIDPHPTPHSPVDDVPSTGHGDGPVHTDTVDPPHHDADAPTVDPGHVAPYGVEDTSALLAASEATGGHLIERHVGQTFDDLSARLEGTRLPVVSSFGTADEAASAVSTALQHNHQVVDEWISNGAVGKIELDAPFGGGEVLRRGTTEAEAGSGVRVVLKGDGTGGLNRPGESGDFISCEGWSHGRFEEVSS
ncbi:RNase A-like domain-containing protein [Mycobacterium sp. NPDC003449]